MNTQLIPVFAGELSGAPVQLVDARLLHTFLEVVTKFNDWIKNRIEEYGFVKDQDFLVAEILATKTGRGGNRKPVIDYHLSIDMAKELGMIERNDKGRQIRRYFLEMERVAQTKQKMSPPANTEQPQTLDGRILLTIRNGQIVSSEPLPERAKLFTPNDAPSIRSWVFNYIPYQHLHIALEAINERSMAIARGMNPQLTTKA